jgi:putative FmdB family regulatory protein
MPTYVYRCPSCAREFERFERMSAAASACPDCGTRAQRVISGGGGMLVKGAASPPPPSTCCGGGACGLN